MHLFLEIVGWFAGVWVAYHVYGVLREGHVFIRKLNKALDKSDEK